MLCLALFLAVIMRGEIEPFFNLVFKIDSLFEFGTLVGAEILKFNYVLVVPIISASVEEIISP